MKKIIRLTENDLTKIIKKVLYEDISSLPEFEEYTQNQEGVSNVECIQLALKKANLGNMLGDTGPNKDGVDGKYGNRTRSAVIEFQKRNGIKQTGFVGQLTAPKLGCQPMSKSKSKVNPNIEPKPQPKPTEKTNVCPPVESSSNFRELPEMISVWSQKFPKLKKEEVIGLINRMIDRDANALMSGSKKPISIKTACQAASIGRRPKYNNKYIFIIDSPNKWITLFDKPSGNMSRKIIAQDWIIDGMSKQKNDAKSIATAFTTLNYYYDIAQKKHPKWSSKQLEDEMYRLEREAGGDFLPAGIYQGKKISSEKSYAGGSQNVLGLSNWNNTPVSHAVHGFYGGDNRLKFANKAMRILQNPDDIKQQQEFLRELKSGGLKMDWSYGCINTDPKFLPYLRKYGPESFIFNIDETTENYLVQNSENFFNKMMESESCPSPSSLGAETIA